MQLLESFEDIFLAFELIILLILLIYLKPLVKRNSIIIVLIWYLYDVIIHSNPHNFSEVV